MENLPTCPPAATACLLLATGEAFFGHGIGKPGIAVGEICFNTAMTGYQEVLTDPSYAGQIITFTFPHIGNVGCNPEDIEAKVPHARGLVIRDPITLPSNYRHTDHLTPWLITHGITGIYGIDTRALTRRIRTKGACTATIVYGDAGKLDLTEAKKQLAAAPSLEGMELACGVSTDKAYEWTQTRWKQGSGYGTLTKPLHHVVAFDFGEKLNILRSLAERGCRITVVPATTSAENILKMKPDGIFLSNGPGDPAATGKKVIPALKSLIDSGVPVFGICLGHQLLGLALGAKTEKMHQGHRGANHPIKNLETGRVEITSQNHGFVVALDSLPKNVKATHVSLFDGTLAGMRVTDKPVFSVQYHPEASPGPHDSQYLFDEFVGLIQRQKAAA